MKRFIIAMALVVFMTGAVSAEGMMFGIKGGLNMANITGDLEDTKMKMAFGGGVWVNFAVTETFSIQPELFLMNKGVKADIDEDAGIKLSYIDIPILGKFSVPTEGNFGFNFFGGPYIGFLMSAEAYYEDEEEDIKDFTESLDYGLVFGAGFDYMLESGCITFDARYALGLANLAKDDEGDDESIKNAGIQILVGYGFAF
ncbi:MAG: PorT family protein [Candidatus Krumholzibacteria bacterium]|nr:PorT family protein [Candidatus Krumholzibacteria bacterium]